VPAWEAGTLLDCVEQHEAKKCAKARHGLQQVQGLCIVVLGGCADRECEVLEQCIVLGDECQGDLARLVHSRIAKALSPPARLALCFRQACVKLDFQWPTVIIKGTQ
jgi:hypothetical protein